MISLGKSPKIKSQIIFIIGDLVVAFWGRRGNQSEPCEYKVCTFGTFLPG